MSITVSKQVLHPGIILESIYMTDRGLNPSTLAEALGCQPRKINEIVNGKRGITPEFAIQLGKVFDTTPDMWVRLQADYELSVALNKDSSESKSGYRPISASEV